jgi:hypothetical protein
MVLTVLYVPYSLRVLILHAEPLCCRVRSSGRLTFDEKVVLHRVGISFRESLVRLEHLSLRVLRYGLASL